MSLISSAPFSNLTIYRKDYTKKDCPRPPKNFPVQDYKDPVTGPFQDYVLPNFKYQKLPKPQTEYPDPKEYAKHVAACYPSTRTFLRDPPGGPPDLDTIDSLYQDDNRTIYMISYCKRGDYESNISGVKGSDNLLPEDWDIPLTTHRCSYRNPRLMAPETISKIPFSTPKDNLSPNQRERELLQVKTGETIYMSDISNTGMEIIKGRLHGDVNIRPQFDPEDLIKAKLIRTE